MYRKRQMKILEEGFEDSMTVMNFTVNKCVWL